MSDHVTKLYDADGALIGVLLSPEAWKTVEPNIAGQFLSPEADPEPTEQLHDWETLKNFWGFPYPVDTDVSCESCGAETDDFQADDPRKFLLTAAGLSGLVSFYCRNCKAKIIKRHFKDEIVCETRPFQPTKTFRNEARFK